MKKIVRKMSVICNCLKTTADSKWKRRKRGRVLEIEIKKTIMVVCEKMKRTRITGEEGKEGIEESIGSNKIYYCNNNNESGRDIYVYNSTNSNSSYISRSDI